MPIIAEPILEFIILEAPCGVRACARVYLRWMLVAAIVRVMTDSSRIATNRVV
jgi:hypothetical protein